MGSWLFLIRCSLHNLKWSQPRKGIRDNGDGCVQVNIRLLGEGDIIV